MSSRLWRVLALCRPVLRERGSLPRVPSFHGSKLVLSSPLVVQTHYYTNPPPREKHKDLYAVMGVTPHATQQQIKEAYYKLSMKYHPDKNKNSKEAHSKFTELTESYSVLGSHDLRRKYDKGLLHKYPSRHGTTHATHTAHRDTASTVHGQKVKFDFDEFYRAHYGEALKREQEARRQRAAAKERAKVFTIAESIQRVLIITVVVSVLIIGWYVQRWKEKNSKNNTYPVDRT